MVKQDGLQIGGRHGIQHMTFEQRPEVQKQTKIVQERVWTERD